MDSSPSILAVSRLYELPASFLSMAPSAEYLDYLESTEAWNSLRMAAETLHDTSLIEAVDQLALVIQRNHYGRPELHRFIFDLSRLFGAAGCSPYTLRYHARADVESERVLESLAEGYRAFGLDFRPNLRHDHLGLELEFLALTAFHEGVSIQRGDSANAELSRRYRRFVLRDHVLPCTVVALPAVSSLTSLPLWGAIRGLLEALLTLDAAFLDIAPVRAVTPQPETSVVPLTSH